MECARVQNGAPDEAVAGAGPRILKHIQDLSSRLGTTISKEDNVGLIRVAQTGRSARSFPVILSGVFSSSEQGRRRFGRHTVMGRLFVGVGEPEERWFAIR
jgi:hypothetical protein